MPVTVVQPGPAVRQLSGQLPDEQFYLSVLAKRTYEIDGQGRCVAAAEQLPLQDDIAYDDEAEELVAADTDLVHWKPLTDVVIRGHGHSRDPVRELRLGVRIGLASKVVVASGERRASVAPDGRVLFSPPAPFNQIPLSFALAYGGRDIVAEQKDGTPASRFRHLLPPTKNIDALSPFSYPRNPVGRGFLVEASRAAVEALQLPQLEDPEDRLTPDRLAAGDPLRWPSMPVPQSLGWLGHTWFPRCSFFGVVPAYAGPAADVPEVRAGWISADSLKSRSLEDRFGMRAANGASLGLQLPYLRGDEDGSLHNMSPSARLLNFQLPGDRPRIWTDGRKGKLNKTEPVIHTVLIEPDRRRIAITWRGHARALRRYMNDELATMPLRVEWS